MCAAVGFIYDSLIIYFDVQVNTEYGGQNIAKRLVFCVAENAERAKKKIASFCSYADHILELKEIICPPPFIRVYGSHRNLVELRSM